MKSRIVSKIILIFLLLFPVTNARADSGPDQYRAISLSVLQEKLKDAHGDSAYPKEFLRLTGMTRVIGYIVDGANRDLILFGEIEAGIPPLYLDDFVVALRNTWLKYADLKDNLYYYLAPYCSIEPDLNAVENLKNIGSRISEGSDSQSVEQAIEEWRQTCGSPQSVQIKGIPFNSHFASVLVKADYDMKRLAVGSDSTNISGFASLSDMTLEKAEHDLVQKGSVSIDSSIGNRFWFYPGEVLFLEHEGIIEIDVCRIDLLSGKSYLSKSGKIAGEGKTSELAEAFARRFTAKYADLADERPIYIEFENLFHILALSKGIKFKSSPEKAAIDLGFLLDQYRVSGTSMGKHLPGVPNVKKFDHRVGNQGNSQIAKVWIPFCGGVSMNMKVDRKNFKWDNTGKLSRLRDEALSARPGPDALFWDFSVR